jgi:hypothetical protein
MTCTPFPSRWSLTRVSRCWCCVQVIIWWWPIHRLPTGPAYEATQRTPIAQNPRPTDPVRLLRILQRPRPRDVVGR